MLSKFLFRRLRYSDKTSVLQLIDEHFTPEIAALHGLKNEDFIQLNRIRGRIRLRQGLVFGSFEKATGKLVAAAFHTILTRDFGFEHDSLLLKEADLSPAVKCFLDFKNELMSGLFEKLNVSKILYFDFAVTHKSYRNQGILGSKNNYFGEVAMQEGCEVMVNVTANLNVIGFMKSTGFLVYKKQKYSDYVDPATGSRPFSGLKSRDSILHGLYKRLDSPHSQL